MTIEKAMHFVKGTKCIAFFHRKYLVALKCENKEYPIDCRKKMWQYATFLQGIESI